MTTMLTMMTAMIMITMMTTIMPPHQRTMTLWNAAGSEFSSLELSLYMPVHRCAVILAQWAMTHMLPELNVLSGTRNRPRTALAKHSLHVSHFSVLDEGGGMVYYHPTTWKTCPKSVTSNSMPSSLATAFWFFPLRSCLVPFLSWWLPPSSRCARWILSNVLSHTQAQFQDPSCLEKNHPSSSLWFLISFQISDYRWFFITFLWIILPLPHALCANVAKNSQPDSRLRRWEANRMQGTTCSNFLHRPELLKLMVPCYRIHRPKRQSSQASHQVTSLGPLWYFGPQIPLFPCAHPRGPPFSCTWKPKASVSTLASLSGDWCQLHFLLWYLLLQR